MWTIHEIKNTVEVSEECVKDLFEADAFTYEGEDTPYHERFDHISYVSYNGKLTFNTDDNEHMDYIWEDRYQNVLKKHKVQGDICFADLEGDNRGTFWGYRFNGEGGMVKLKGHVEWEPVIGEPVL